MKLGTLHARRSLCTLLAAFVGIQGASAWAGHPTRSTVARVAKPVVPSGYAQNVRNWHAPTPGQDAPVDSNGRPMLTFQALNTRDRISIPAATDQGGFAASDLDRVAYVLREHGTGNRHPIEPRLLDIVYRLQRQFFAQEIRIISGYRTPRRRSNSNHGKGRAIDLIVPGASDDAIAKFAREIGYVGVGIYPSSGFVHIDVRDRSYFWVDASGPGRRNRERGILGDLAAHADRQAAARGEPRVNPWIIRSDVDGFLRGFTLLSGQAVEEDDDDDEEELGF